MSSSSQYNNNNINNNNLDEDVIEEQYGDYDDRVREQKTATYNRREESFTSDDSRPYTPPLPPLSTPEYVRYLQEQRLGGIDLDARERQRRIKEDENFAPILGPDRNPSLSGSRANSQENLVELERRAMVNNATAAANNLLGGAQQQRQQQDGDGQTQQQQQQQQKDFDTKTNGTNNSQQQQRKTTELKDVAVSLSDDPSSPRHPKNIDSALNSSKIANNKGWLRVDSTGRLTKLTIEKHKISHMLRVPIRDLRVLEPTMSSSYSTSIWCREKSIVVNLEQIKILITAEEIICPDSQNSAVVERYIPELQRRLRRRIKMKESSLKEQEENKGSMKESFSSFTLSDIEKKTGTAERKLSNNNNKSDTKNKNTNKDENNSGYTSYDEEEMKGHEGGHHRNSFDNFGRPTTDCSDFSSEGGSDETLPFEMIALEIALEMVCNALEVESDKVEREGKPQLEKLRQDVNQTNLEKVRRVKNRLVRINARVTKVREEIQRYLDDDSDMRDLYLTRRLKEEHRQNTVRSNRDNNTPSRNGRGLNSQPPLSPLNIVQNQSQRTPGNQNPTSPTSNGGQQAIIGPNGEVWDEDKDLQEVEDLFETYFTHIDSTFRNLEQLNEYIDDMEDLIEIELDSKRNQLIKLELLLTTGTLCLSGFGVVVGIFGMNIKNGIEGSASSFDLVVVLCVLGSVLTFVAIVQACRHFRLF